MKTYHGSCECERVKLEATFDLSKGTFKCNCRMCTKSRFWGASVAPDKLKVTEGEDCLITYWESPKHHFCKHCGVKVFGKAQQGYAVALPVLDDLDPRELAKAPVMYFDGQHDRFDRAPDFKDHL